MSAVPDFGPIMAVSVPCLWPPRRQEWFTILAELGAVCGPRKAAPRLNLTSKSHLYGDHQPHDPQLQAEPQTVRLVRDTAATTTA
jgi:hypothetical protein